MPSQNLIEDYRNLYSKYGAFSKKIESLLIDLLENHKVKIHFTEARAKSPDSLEEKIKRPGKNYNDNLSKINDLAGIRIVLYYEDSIPSAGELIHNEFNVIEEEGTHQPEVYSPDQFGYLSLHFIVSLHEKRSKLPEWEIYKDMKAEIQIRTVLQHSWAAVSHALQYKREGDVPKDLRRRLFRLAGLFELADEEFVAIRDQASNIRSASDKALQGDQSTILIDAPVLRSLLENNENIETMKGELIKLNYNFDRLNGDDDRDHVGLLVEGAERIGMSSIKQFIDLATNYNKKFFTKINKNEWFVSKSFMMLLAMIDQHPESFDSEYLHHIGWEESIADTVLKHAGKY